MGWPLTVIGAGLGAYFGAYLKKKGENIATHEDFENLLSEQKRTTEATKIIKISDEVWDRQRQWEMKRDILITFVRTISDFEQAISDMSIKVENRSKSVYEAEKFSAALATWTTTSAKFQQDSYVVGLVVSVETQNSLGELSNVLRKATSEVLQQEKQEAYKNRHREITTKLLLIRNAIREELGLPLLTPQPTVSPID